MKIEKRYKQFTDYATHCREPFFEIAKKYMIDKEFILDIGAGAGAFADYIGRKDIYLVDGNRASCVELEKRYKNVLHCRLPDTFSYTNHSFDAIHCSHLIEHLSPAQVYSFLQEIDRILRPGGFLIISAPLLNAGFYNDFSHVKPYNPAVFLKYLTRRDSTNTTRSLIGGKYDKIELVWRHTFTQMELPIWGRGTKPTLLNKFLFVLHLLCKRLGFGKYERSGFTLVLRKE